VSQVYLGGEGVTGAGKKKRGKSAQVFERVCGRGRRGTSPKGMPSKAWERKVFGRKET